MVFNSLKVGSTLEMHVTLVDQESSLLQENPVSSKLVLSKEQITKCIGVVQP
jgi:hypothetical protein